MIPLVPGATRLSVAVWRDGRVDRADHGCGPDTRFEIGSVTKTFTARLLRLMAASGEVREDDPVNDHLPPAARLGGPHGDLVTLRHLATHTSGLPMLPVNLLPVAARRWNTNPYAGYTAGHLLRAAGRARIRRRPGGVPRYSTFGMGLLGYALAGEDYPATVVERICAPLGMTATDAVERPGDPVGRNVFGRPVPPIRIPGLPGAGAIRSTTSDLLRYVAAASTMDGWERDGVFYRHTGGTRGFTAYVAFAAVPRVGVVALTDVTPTRRNSVVTPADRLMRSLVGADERCLVSGGPIGGGLVSGG